MKKYTFANNTFWVKPVVMQCNDILRHIASFQLPPVYPWMLELTDGGPGVSVSSAECRALPTDSSRPLFKQIEIVSILTV